MNWLAKLPKPFFVLAPMDDVTDTVFRQIVADCAPPDVYFTEFVNVDGLQSPGRQKLLKKLLFGPKEKPLIAQIWGKDPANFHKTAEQIADGTFAKELGLKEGLNFAGVDLNMGCPQKAEVGNGTCSALINDRPLADSIIEATRAGLKGKLPLSVKTRIGFNDVDMTWISFLLEHHLDMLTVHGRTRKQMSKVPADWNIIGEARRLRDDISPETLIVGNGDVLSRKQGITLAKEHDLDGIMIARGIFQNPYVFSDQNEWQSFSRESKIELYRNHIKIFASTWISSDRPIYTLNKFCKIYIQGFEGAKEIREELMNTRTTIELLDMIERL